MSENGGHISACLQIAPGQPAGAGYRMGFSISGREMETGPTDASGCATLDFPIDVKAKFQPVYAKDGDGQQFDVKKVPAQGIYRGDKKSIDVELKR